MCVRSDGISCSICFEQKGYPPTIQAIFIPFPNSPFSSKPRSSLTVKSLSQIREMTFPTRRYVKTLLMSVLHAAPLGVSFVIRHGVPPFSCKYPSIAWLRVAHRRGESGAHQTKYRHERLRIGCNVEQKCQKDDDDGSAAAFSIADFAICLAERVSWHPYLAD